MLPKHLCLAALAFVLGLTCAAFAERINWSDASPDDHDWSSPDNWNTNTVPTNQQVAYTNGQGAALTEVSSDTATCSGLCNAYLHDHDFIIRSGARVKVVNDVYAGMLGSQHANATFTVEKGGQLDVGGLFRVIHPMSSTANMEVTLNVAGRVNIAGALEVSRPVAGAHHGTVNLLDGRINCGGLSMGRRGASTPADSMNITGGVLHIAGDAVDQIEGYVENGSITAYGGVGSVRAYYLAPLNRTVVGAVSPNIEIVVEADLHDSGHIGGSLERYVADLTREGFKPHVHRCAETTPQALRAYLKSLYDENGLAGVVLVEATEVNKIPRALFEERFPPDRGPIDLYYGDLDGFWDDEDGNGKFDVWHNGPSGDMEREIWVGRISTTTTQRLNDYFDRNHAYRTGAMKFEEHALIWVEPGWTVPDEIVGIAYKNMVSYHAGDPAITRETYHKELQKNYEWLFHSSHSGSTGNDWIWSSKVQELNTHVAFAHFYACRTANYYETPTCLAGEMVFGTDYGLASLGQANSGGVGANPGFYQRIAEGRSIGEATYFLCTSVEPDGSYNASWVDWLWGITIHGDPTLRPQGEPIPDEAREVSPE